MKKRIRRLNKILKTVANYYGTTLHEVKRPNRKARVAHSRHIFFYVAHELGYMHEETSEHINRDRCTSLHSCGRIKDFIDVHENLRDKIIENDVSVLMKKCEKYRKTTLY